MTTIDLGRPTPDDSRGPGRTPRAHLSLVEPGATNRRWVILAGTQTVFGRHSRHPFRLLVEPISTPENSVLSLHISRDHFELRLTPHGTELVDLGSRRGTFVGAERLEHGTPFLAPDSLVVSVGGALTLEVVAMPGAEGEAGCVCIRRQDNYTQQTYVLLEGTASIGPDADNAVRVLPLSKRHARVLDLGTRRDPRAAMLKANGHKVEIKCVPGHEVVIDGVRLAADDSCVLQPDMRIEIDGHVFRVEA